MIILWRGIEGLANSIYQMNDNIKGCLFSAKLYNNDESLDQI